MKNMIAKNAASGAYLQKRVAWKKTGSPLEPWKAQVGEEGWKVLIGDFPEEDLYTLVVDGERALSFNDWPDSWTREADPRAAATTKSGTPRSSQSEMEMRARITALERGLNDAQSKISALTKGLPRESKLNLVRNRVAKRHRKNVSKGGVR